MIIQVFALMCVTSVCCSLCLADMTPFVTAWAVAMRF